jgi:hypothetical protein
MTSRLLVIFTGDRKVFQEVQPALLQQRTIRLEQGPRNRTALGEAMNASRFRLIVLVGPARARTLARRCRDRGMLSVWFHLFGGPTFKHLPKHLVGNELVYPLPYQPVATTVRTVLIAILNTAYARRTRT